MSRLATNETGKRQLPTATPRTRHTYSRTQVTYSTALEVLYDGRSDAGRSKTENDSGDAFPLPFLRFESFRDLFQALTLARGVAAAALEVGAAA